jgi:hypothetical protein
MSEHQVLDRYSGQTLDELLALASSHRVESLVRAMAEALERRAERDGSGSLTAEERIILAVEALEREVTSGGFDQFFRKPSRQYTGEIESALRTIGCLHSATIIAHAVQSLGIRGIPTATLIERALYDGGDDLAETLRTCDGDYYSATENIAELLFAFVQANRSTISIP